MEIVCCACVHFRLSCFLYAHTHMDASHQFPFGKMNASYAKRWLYRSPISIGIYFSKLTFKKNAYYLHICTNRAIVVCVCVRILAFLLIPKSNNRCQYKRWLISSIEATTAYIKDKMCIIIKVKLYRIDSATKKKVTTNEPIEISFPDFAHTLNIIL